VRRLALQALLVALIALLAPPAAFATTATAAATTGANATLPDIEDEVMCTICGTTLQLSSSPQAERERAFISALIAKGETKDEIKDALVAEYGPEVLAVPSDDGFDLLGGWILPTVAVLVGASAVGLAARRWRRDQRRAEADATPAGGPEPDAEDEQRLTEDLRRYEA